MVSVFITVTDLGLIEMPYQCIFLLFSDIDQLTYSVLPRDSGVGESSWAGLCFSRSQWSMVTNFFVALILNLLIYTLATVNVIQYLLSWQEIETMAADG